MKTLQRYAQLVIAILVLAGCAATPTQESTGEYLDDTTITTKVKTALLNDPVSPSMSRPSRAPYS